MTDPTRDALHAETIVWLKNKRDSTTGGERSRRILAYAAECVKRVPELEAEVERQREVMHEAAARCREIAGMVGDAHELATEYARHTAIGLDAKARPTPRTDG